VNTPILDVPHPPLVRSGKLDQADQASVDVIVLVDDRHQAAISEAMMLDIPSNPASPQVRTFG